jgi:hypothetical protein
MTRRESFLRLEVLLVFFPFMALAASAQPLLPQPPAHPRILLLKGEEDQLKNKIAVNPDLAAVNSIILAEAEKIISAPPVERKLTGKRLLDVSREALRRLFFLSYAYRTTGDMRYARRGEEELVAIAAFQDWHPDHFLDVAEMTTAAAIAYDQLYSALSPETRDLVRLAIRQKGLEPSFDKRYNSWLKLTNNWNQVCSASMAIGALAVWEDDPVYARRVIERSAEALRIPMREYDPDGGYPEGYGYWGYGTTYNVLFLSAMEKAFGTDFGLKNASPGFLKTPVFLCQMLGPSGLPFNFSDAGTAAELNPAMFWFAATAHDSSLLLYELRFLRSSPNRFARERFLPALVFWAPDSLPAGLCEPTTLDWMGRGRTPIAILRSSWDTNALYLAIKGGSPSTNHAHMDIGEFVMDWGGQRWAMDFGMQDYNSLESKGVDLWNARQNSQRWDVFRYGNAQHNTLTVDGERQIVSGKADIIEFSDKEDFPYAITDLTSLYSAKLASARRGIALVKGKWADVKDELETQDAPVRVRWIMLTSAKVAFTPEGDAVLTKNGKTLTLRIMSPQKAMWQTWSTDPPHDYDAPNPGTTLLGFEITLGTKTQATFEVAMLPDGIEASNLPALKAWRSFTPSGVCDPHAINCLGVRTIPRSRASGETMQESPQRW